MDTVKSVANRVGHVVGKGANIAGEKASEYDVMNKLGNARKRAYEKAGVGPVVGDMIAKVGTAAIGIGMVASALPTVAIGGVATLGAYCVGKELAPQATDKVRTTVKTAEIRRHKCTRPRPHDLTVWLS